MGRPELPLATCSAQPWAAGFSLWGWFGFSVGLHLGLCFPGLDSERRAEGGPLAELRAPRGRCRRQGPHFWDTQRGPEGWGAGSLDPCGPTLILTQRVSRPPRSLEVSAASLGPVLSYSFSLDCDSG